MTRENERLAEDKTGAKKWRRWGPYLSERQWGTVREDDSDHGNSWASFPHDHFLVVQAVPGTTSGCSIDAMTKGVEGILSRTSVDVLGPDQVFFREKDGTIAHLDFRNIKAAVLSGRLTADSTVFDASMGQGSDLRKWEVPLSATWMSRFLLQTA